MEARLKTEIWVSAALRRSNMEGQPGVVIRKGDPDAGAVLAVLRGREGLVVLNQTRTAAGDSAWMRATGPAPVDEAAADACIAKQLRFDPDLWVVEFESPTLAPPFEARLV